MSKLIFPALTCVYLILMLVSDAFPEWFVPGIAWVFLVAALLCAVLSWVGFVKGGK